ncbi:MAG: DUF3108 domain-containing protein [Methylotenera sp.]
MHNKIQNLLLQLKQHRKLALAVLPSLVFHGLLFMLFSIELPELESDTQLIQARLMQLELPQTQVVQTQVVQTEVAKTKAQPVPKPKQRTPENPPKKPTEALAEKPPTDAQAGAANPDTLSFGTLSSATLNMGNPGGAKPGGMTPEQNSIQNNDETTPYRFESEPEILPYTKVEAEFEVKRGSDSTAAGLSRVSFHVDKNKRYTIVSQTEAKGLVSLFFSTLQQKSEGSVTDAGLKPDFYSYQYGSNSKKLQTASFDWEKQLLTMRSSKGENTVPLVAGTQDFLSFMYQFMFTPPLNSLQIMMTNGKKLGTYQYRFEGEEIITSKFGELNTIHLAKGSDDEEKTELWLATDYQYLPVKIRKTEKDGTVIEQLVSKLSTSQIN